MTSWSLVVRDTRLLCFVDHLACTHVCTMIPLLWEVSNHMSDLLFTWSSLIEVAVSDCSLYLLLLFRNYAFMPPMSILSCSKEYMAMHSKGNRPFGDGEQELELDKDMSEID